MNITSFSFSKLMPNLFVYRGAVNCGILQCGDRAILIDCDDTLTPEVLAELGIRSVEKIFCTQHRRPNTAGISAFQAAVVAPQGERAQFEQAGAYWQDWRNRWHIYHFRPGALAPLHDISVSESAQEGAEIAWGDFTIQVIATPGMTDGAVTYRVAANNQAVIFSGDVIYAAGQVWDVHSLQKNTGAFSDYHGYLGATKTLISSLEKLRAASTDCLVPSHGSVIREPAAAVDLTISRLKQLYRNYAATSALNYYFPHIFQELCDDPLRMSPTPTVDFPDFIRPVAATSFSIHSESGALFLIDCGDDSVLNTLRDWKEQGVYTQIEGCWVTHYHDDHVDSLHHLPGAFPAPIYADQHIAEILIHPERFFLPCISPAAAPVTHITTEGETWQWHEFELTALHFPGQTLYHGGLLIRGRGATILLAGDSFAPTGLDDYTAGNRNWMGAGQGYRRCIDLIRRYHPDLILNQHQHKAFHFSTAQLDYLEEMLIEREKLLEELLPWENLNFGVDAGWLRAYPYEIEAWPGETCMIEVRATNHAGRAVEMSARPALPPGWRGENNPAASSFTKEINGESITCAPVKIPVPKEAPAGVYPVGLRVTWDGQYLGQVCHALVNVRS